MKRIITSLVLCLVVILCYSQPVTSANIDNTVEQAMKSFNVPGIAVAVVKDGRIIHSKGYGIRSINTNQKMDENTLFAIASNTKAFTAAALGILVDDGKLDWNDRVIDYIPEFRMYNPYVTEEFTIKDMLTHRSGLGLGAGDLMFWPDSATFTKKDIIYNLRFLKPASSFRNKYDYDNLMYIVAGEVVARISGMSWEDFVETRIMQPLEMKMSAASINRLKDKTNIIDAHVPVDGKLQVVGKHEGDVHNSAGGIFSNITDMSKWVIAQINDGKYGDSPEEQIFSREVHEEMWAPQTIKPVGKTAYNSHFLCYGLGWNVSDEKGYKVVYHTGELAGVVTRVTIIPELRLGIIVFTNQQSIAAHTAITNTIKDGYYGIKGIDRVKEEKEKVLKNEADASRITAGVWKQIQEEQKKNTTTADIKKYQGIYSDQWFGDVVISERNGKLWFASRNSPMMAGEMIYYKGNTFIVRWRYRTFDADAFAVFSLDKNGNPDGITMEAISPLTDFSFDFQDLYLKRINQAE